MAICAGTLSSSGASSTVFAVVVAQTAKTSVAAAGSSLRTAHAVGRNEALLPLVRNKGRLAQLTLGPSVMLLLVAMECLKNRLTSSNTNQVYEDTWNFVSKAESRDKFGRLVQCACRCLQGYLAVVPTSSLMVWKPAICEIQSRLAWARRTTRWGKAMPHLAKLVKSLEAGDYVEALTSAILIIFLIQDHIYWLLKVKALKFHSYTPWQWHRRNLRLITINYVLSFCLSARKIKRIRDYQAQSDDEMVQTENDIWEHKKRMFRLLLTFVQMLHVTQLKEFDDRCIGLMGIASSLLDACKQLAY